MALFNYYPTINYNSQTAVNLLVESEVVRSFLSDYTKFFSYLIREGERADTIAYEQYGDPTLDWVIYLVNGVIDPYKDWLMDDKQFIAYMEDKYNKTSYLLQSTSTANTIAYYYYSGLTSDTTEIKNAYNYNMSRESYVKLGSPSGWTAKSIWDYEKEINDSKREIKLLRPVYINDFKQQIKDLFING